MEMTNATEFVLKGFAGGRTLHMIMFVIVLLVFLVSLAGNILMIGIICSDYLLHSPMYFFLVSLSLLENLGISTVIPKLLSILLVEKATISMTGCFTQSYFYFYFFSSVFLILAVMSFDRYVAICYPLRYLTIMRNSVCVKLVVGCLITSFVCLLYPTVTMTNLPFCGHVLDYFFCDSEFLLRLICADTSLIKLAALISSVFILIIPLSVTVTSYICIVYTVIKISSDRGRQKTFSTCISHLTIVSIVFGSGIFIKIRPKRQTSVEHDKIVNLVSTILGPLVNPFIYTLRNQMVKDSIRQTMRRNRIWS